MADLIYAGMTGAQFLAALNIRKGFNVLDYGAIGNNSTVNTTELQAVIDLAHTTGGTVYIPSGIYKTGKLTTYFNVRIEGDGYQSILKSVAAEPLIETLYSAYQNGDHGLHNLTLDGDSMGTIGYNTQMLNAFIINNVQIRKFTAMGAKLHGSLIGSVTDCVFSECVIGVSAETHSAVPNLVTFKNCYFNTNTKYGVQWLNGFMLKFIGCDFENSGTSSDDTTGAIYYKGSGAIGSESAVGLIADGCWFEANHGIGINLDEPVFTQAQLSALNNCMFVKYGTDTSSDIKILGASTINRLLLNGSCLQNDASLLIDGANASVVNNQSVLSGTVTKNNSGKYFTTDYTEVV